MSRPTDDLPDRLLAGGATDFERRVLEIAREQRPSPAASARMAKALGLTSAFAASAATAKTLAADAATAKATAAAGASTIWPWISAGVLGLVVAGAIVGTRARHAAPTGDLAPRSVTASAPPVAEPPRPNEASTDPEAPSSIPGPDRRSRGLASTSELRDQSPSSTSRGPPWQRTTAGARSLSCVATRKSIRPGASVRKPGR